MTYQRLLGVVAVGLTLGPTPAWAQDKPAGTAPEAADPATGATKSGEAPAAEGDAPPDAIQNAPTEEASAEREGEETEASAEAKLVADAEMGGSPVELPGRTYYFVGARYRFIYVPKFMINLFGDGGKSVGVHSGGAEFAIRKDGFEYNFGAWFASYGMSPTEFKSKNDTEEAWELVESKIKVVFLTADFLWSHDFTPEFALNYGMGAGFGLVFGPLYRNQAFRNASGDFEECQGENNPVTAVDYCGADNDHYNDYEEPNWANGGSKPLFFPWLAAQTGFRYKAHRNFVARLDLGFGTSGFFVGVGGDYGL